MTQEGGPFSFPVIPILLDLVYQTGVIGALLFLCKQSLAWTGGWLYLVLYAAWSVANVFCLWRNNPGLLLKRLNSATPVFAIDRCFAWSIVAAFAATLCACALYPAALSGAVGVLAPACGFAGLAASYALASYALAVNRFAVKTVMIQAGQEVTRGGPYAYVRHPLYAALIVFSVCTPAALGSVYGYVPAAVLALLLAGRAFYEDRFLAQKLAGYSAYAAEVRWMLVPRVV